MSDAGQRLRIFKRLAQAGAPRRIRTFEDGKLVSAAAVRNRHHAADARGKVRRVRFKAPRAERGFKGFARGKELVNRVGLIPVGNDGAFSKHAHGRINDEAWIFHFAFIKRMDDKLLPLFDEYAVLAVLTATHDEISHCSLLAGRAHAHQHAAAYIAVFF